MPVFERPSASDASTRRRPDSRSSGPPGRLGGDRRRPDRRRPPPARSDAARTARRRRPPGPSAGTPPHSAQCREIDQPRLAYAARESPAPDRCPAARRRAEPSSVNRWQSHVEDDGVRPMRLDRCEPRSGRSARRPDARAAEPGRKIPEFEGSQVTSPVSTGTTASTQLPSCVSSGPRPAPHAVRIPDRPRRAPAVPHRPAVGHAPVAFRRRDPARRTETRERASSSPPRRRRVHLPRRPGRTDVGARSPTSGRDPRTIGETVQAPDEACWLSAAGWTPRASRRSSSSATRRAPWHRRSRDTASPSARRRPARLAETASRCCWAPSWRFLRAHGVGPPTRRWARTR